MGRCAFDANLLKCLTLPGRCRLHLPCQHFSMPWLNLSCWHSWSKLMVSGAAQNLHQQSLAQPCFCWYSISPLIPSLVLSVNAWRFFFLEYLKFSTTLTQQSPMVTEHFQVQKLLKRIERQSRSGKFLQLSHNSLPTGVKYTILIDSSIKVSRCTWLWIGFIRAFR